MPSRPAPCGRAECRFGKRVVSRGIQCDYCGMWYHFSCASINEKEATRLGRSDDVFSCPSCSSRGETNTMRSPNNILDLLKKTRANVVKFIPKASSRHFAKLLKDCLCQVVASPEDEFNWVRLFRAATSCIRQPDRGGTRKRKSLATILNQQIQEFENVQPVLPVRSSNPTSLPFKLGSAPGEERKLRSMLFGRSSKALTKTMFC